MECLAFLLSVDLLIFWFIIQSVDLKFWYANIKFYSVDLACCWFNFFKLRLGALRPRSVGQSVGLLVGPPKITKKMTKLYKTFQTIKEELFDRRQPLTEDNLWRKTTFGRRRPLTEDDLWRKMTLNGRGPSIGLQYITWIKYLLLTLTATAQLTPNPKYYQLSMPEIEFHVMVEMYVALCMWTCAEKTTFFGKEDK